MATIQTKGLDELIAKMEQLTTLSKSREFVGRAIFEGAAVAKGGMLSQINSLPVQQRYAGEGEKLHGITSVQKKGLLDGFGIAKMRKDGGAYNVKLGFDGYNGQKTTKWPHGQPNSMIARSIVSGTSFRAKNNFVGKAVRATKEQAIEAMREEIYEQIDKIMK